MTYTNAQKLERLQAAIDCGRARLPVWIWPPLGPYNGWTGERRAEVWQLQTAARKIGLIPRPSECSICRRAVPKLQLHNENYGDPFDYYPICAGHHGVLHKRYNAPRAWQVVIREFGKEGDWFLDLPTAVVAPAIVVQHVTLQSLTIRALEDTVHPVAKLGPSIIRGRIRSVIPR